MREKISGVYKITNMVNGLFYIGSAKDIHTRWKQHKRNLRNGDHNNAHLQNAWNLYGEQSFLFEILETCPPDKRLVLEQKYINETECYKQEIGYNVQRWVLMPNNCVGEKSMNTNYTDKQVKQVVELLKNPDLSYNEIAELTNTTFSLVDGVYCKRTWTHLSEGVDFPVRAGTAFKHKLDDDQVREIVQRLLNNESDESIAKDYNVTWRTIKDIRCHNTHKEITDGINFGSRKRKGEEVIFAKLTSDQVLQIIELYNNYIPIKDISNMFRVKQKTIVSIIRKKSWKNITKDIYIRPYEVSQKIKLTEHDVIEIIKKNKNGSSIDDLALEYCVSSSCIRRAILGESWKNIDRSKI